MQVVFPWYPRELSPNSRIHWAKLAKFKKDYRIAWWAIAAKECRFINLPEGKISLTIEFYPPSRRHYDLDNCLASIKSGLDGLADALQINDRRFLLTVRMVEEVKGYIKVTIQERERDETDHRDERGNGSNH